MEIWFNKSAEAEGQVDVACVGAGQLGWMLYKEIKRSERIKKFLGREATIGFSNPKLDCSVRPLSENPDADYFLEGGFYDEATLLRMAQVGRVLTWEIEHTGAAYMKYLKDHGLSRAIIQPEPETLMVIQDKYEQHLRLANAGVPTAPFKELHDDPQAKKIGLEAAVHQLGGYPLHLKARRGGYDGRSNFTIKGPEDLEAAVKAFAGRQVYVEGHMPFDRELSVLVARDRRGLMKTYPTVETQHNKDDVCDVVISPARISSQADENAQDVAMKAISIFEGAGVFAVEMFLMGDDAVVNEVAPRVHNSYHGTIEGNQTSQFEQHGLAILGAELGPTEMLSRVWVMTNILGDKNNRADVQAVLAGAKNHRDVFVHDYNKYPPSENRKVGHVTALGDDIEETVERALRVRDLAFK